MENVVSSPGPSERRGSLIRTPRPETKLLRVSADRTDVLVARQRPTAICAAEGPPMGPKRCQHVEVVRSEVEAGLRQIKL